MSLFYVRYVRQQLLKTGAEDVNSLRLHVAKNSAWYQHNRMLVVRLQNGGVLANVRFYRSPLEN